MKRGVLYLGIERRLALLFAVALLAQLICLPPARADESVRSGAYALTRSGSSGSSGGSSAGTLALDVGVYPTRNGSSMVFFTWNASALPIKVSLRRAVLYFTKTNPQGRIAFNKGWSVNDDNLFSKTLSYDYKYEIDVNTFRDGEYFRQEFPYSGYYVVGAVLYKLGGVWCGDYYCPYQQTTDNYITTAAPSLTCSGDTLTIGSVCEGRRVLEFRRTDAPYGGSTGITDETTLNEMLLTSLVDTEADNPLVGYYSLGDAPTLFRWKPGRHSVGVRFQSTVNQDVFEAAIDRTLEQLNAVMSEFGVSFYRSGTSGELSIIVDTEESLFPDAVANRSYYGGTWLTRLSGPYIVGATIRYACDFRNYTSYNPYESVVFEELLQTMGAGYDQTQYYGDTVHVDFNYYNKPAELTARDADILRLVYSGAVNAGDSYTTVSRKLNIPAGCYMPSTDTQNRQQLVSCKSFLDAGASYQVRAFVVDATGRVSGTSPWVDVRTL